MAQFGRLDYLFLNASVCREIPFLEMSYGEWRKSIDTSRPARLAVPEYLPMRRYGITGEIASTVLFMCSKASGFVTGQTLRANGGQMMGFRFDPAWPGSVATASRYIALA